MKNCTSPRSASSWLRGVTRTSMLAAVAATSLLVTACEPGELLTVEDPDIINPTDVQSAAGANAVRLGALARLANATSGGNDNADNLFLLGGMFADEWINGDSFIARQEIDQRVITTENSFLTNANRALHRARLSAEQALDLLTQFNPSAPGWQGAEMHLVQAFVINLMAEHYCSGLVFSTVVDGREQYGTPITTIAALEKALKHTNDGLAMVTGTTADDIRVRQALQVTRGRILMNLNRPSEAATAVAGVPTSFRYQVRHSATTESNFTWLRNNLQRRYSVGNNEGGTGLNFATAGDPRVPVCSGGDANCRAIGVANTSRDDLSRPYHVQMIWTARETPVTIIGGIEARMLEAEAQLRANNTAGALVTLNTARTTVPGLAPLTSVSVDQLFRERAFWMFGTGHRVGDLRRLIRQYGRAPNAVFPTGTWHKSGSYGADVTIPIPAAEQNNPNTQSGQICLSREA